MEKQKRQGYLSEPGVLHFAEDLEGQVYTGEVDINEEKSETMHLLS